jgi:hypothetical protein
MAKTSTVLTGPVNIGAGQTVTSPTIKPTEWRLTMTCRWDNKMTLDFSSESLRAIFEFIESVERMKIQPLTYKIWRP